jgi:hypothetical protein
MILLLGALHTNNPDRYLDEHALTLFHSTAILLGPQPFLIVEGMYREMAVRPSDREHEEFCRKFLPPNSSIIPTFVCRDPAAKKTSEGLRRMEQFQEATSICREVFALQPVPTCVADVVQTLMLPDNALYAFRRKPNTRQQSLGREVHLHNEQREGAYLAALRSVPSDGIAAGLIGFAHACALHRRTGHHLVPLIDDAIIARRRITPVDLLWKSLFFRMSRSLMLKTISDK